MSSASPGPSRRHRSGEASYLGLRSRVRGHRIEHGFSLQPVLRSDQHRCLRPRRPTVSFSTVARAPRAHPHRCSSARIRFGTVQQEASWSAVVGSVTRGAQTPPSLSMRSFVSYFRCHRRGGGLRHRLAGLAEIGTRSPQSRKRKRGFGQSAQSSIRGCGIRVFSRDFRRGPCGVSGFSVVFEPRCSIPSFPHSYPRTEFHTRRGLESVS